MTRPRAALILLLFSGVLSVLASEAHAGCNLLLGTTRTFAGTLGATNRPFAAPGELVEIEKGSLEPRNPVMSVSEFD